MTYEEYRQYCCKVVKSRMRRLWGRGVVCVDRIHDCWHNRTSLKDAIECVYNDTIYWEGLW